MGNILPQPDKDIANELPGATDKAKNTRGTFLWWVLSSCVAIISILAVLFNNSNNSRLMEKNAVIAAKDAELIKKDLIIEALNKRLDEQIEKVERILAYGVSGLEAAKSKADNLEAVVKQNAATYNMTEKTLQNEARKN